MNIFVCFFFFIFGVNAGRRIHCHCHAQSMTIPYCTLKILSNLFLFILSMDTLCGTQMNRTAQCDKEQKEEEVM